MGKKLDVADDFLFTQNSLSTFEKSPIEFKKRYIDNISLDDVLDSEKQNIIENGTNFHLIAHRYFLGIDQEQILSNCDERLYLWYKNLVSVFPIDEKKVYFPEYTLRLKKGIIRLEANYDLILVNGENIEIWDFKTSTNNMKNSSNYINSLQTKVYLYVLKELSHLVCGNLIPEENIKMYYWTPISPGIIAKVDYDKTVHEEYGAILKEKIESILDYEF